MAGRYGISYESCVMTRRFLLLIAFGILFQSAAPAAEKTSIAPRTKEQVQSLVERTVIPKLELHDIPFREALAYLQAESQRLDRNGNGVSITTHLPPPDPDRRLPSDPNDLKISVNLSNIPLSEAVRYVSGLGNCTAWIRPNGVHVFYAIHPILTEDFRIPAQFFPYYANRRSKDGGNDPAKIREDFQAFLVRQGVNFREGDEAILSSDGTSLTARNGPRQLDFIQRILDLADPSKRWPHAIPGPNAPKVFDSPTQVRVEQLRKKLRTIVLPKVEFKNVPVVEAVASLRKQAALDAAWSALEERGTRIVLAENLIESGSSVSYAAEKPSLAEALTGIAKAIGLHAHFLEDGVILSDNPKGADLIVREYLIPPPGYEEFILFDRSVDDIKRSWRNPVRDLPIRFYSPETGRYVACLTEKDHRSWQQYVENNWKVYYAEEKAWKKRSR